MTAPFTGLMASLGVGNIPDDIPPVLAIAIAINGYTESEAREMMVESGDADKADSWIADLRAGGFFSHSTPTDSDSDNSIEAIEGTDGRKIMDGGTYLWKTLQQNLEEDENGFKHQMFVLDCDIKAGFMPISDLKKHPAEGLVPFSDVGDKCPWNGCKFASSVVLHLISGSGLLSKQEAAKPVSRSLGGHVLPSPAELSITRWPYILSEMSSKAERAVMDTGTCTAIHINVTDVEIQRHPAKSKFVLRPGTFAHTLVMTVSPAGVYLFQAYGPRGYTLLQYMKKHDAKFPMSLSEGKPWVERFEEFAAELGGVWTKKVNDAYDFCFDVNLVELGNMRIGSQLDAYTTVYSYEFDANLVRRNFDLLPQPNGGRKIPCHDGESARQTKLSPRYTPDGGIDHYYVPVVLRCGHCGANESKNRKTCASCKKVYYCGRDCQVKDWRERHKKVCKSLIGKSP
jgi:hypothetical protein